eukprot:2983973-Rhodomonas_salina.4
MGSRQRIQQNKLRAIFHRLFNTWLGEGGTGSSAKFLIVGRSFPGVLTIRRRGEGGARSRVLKPL